MKLKEIFSLKNRIFVVTNQDDDNEMNWLIQPTDFQFIPEEENLYIVKAIEISNKLEKDIFIGINIPERIAEIVIRKNFFGKVKLEDIDDQKNEVIPAIASECFGDYNLFYAKQNPEIGIDILKDALNKVNNKNVVAEDLGYILRDENRIEEAIEVFKESERYGPSSEFTFLELSNLYEMLGDIEKQTLYFEKYKDNGGLEF